MDDDLSSEDEDDEGEDDKEPRTPKSTCTDQSTDPAEPSLERRPPVRYFQQALSAVWSSLPRSTKREYERKALEWRIDGPSKEMQQKYVCRSPHTSLLVSSFGRQAEKGLSEMMRHFALTVLKQMGVRVTMLITYQDTKSRTVTCELPFFQASL